MSAGNPSKHAPARFSTYFAAHENQMEQLRRAGFVGEDTLIVEAYPATPPKRSVLSLLGEISCRGNIIVSVTKILEKVNDDDDDPLIQTVEYAYHAFVRGGGNIFRYDNMHPRSDHADQHHKHDFAFPTGEESVEWVGADRWPTLGDVIRKLMAWHSDNYHSLAEPDAFSAPENVAYRFRSGQLP